MTSNRTPNLAYLAAHVGCIRLGTAGTLAGLSDLELERMVRLIREAETEQGGQPLERGEELGRGEPGHEREAP